MRLNRKQISVLVADDDADDRIMIKDALEANALGGDVQFVEDGEELLDYLRRKGSFSDRAGYCRPGLILLDLNMPKKDGREALAEIKNDEKLRDIPIVVLTTSKAEEDVFRTYNLGVNSYVTKPVTFTSLVQLTRELGRYWFEIVELPPSGTQRTQ